MRYIPPIPHNRDMNTAAAYSLPVVGLIAAYVTLRPVLDTAFSSLSMIGF